MKTKGCRVFVFAPGREWTMANIHIAPTTNPESTLGQRTITLEAEKFAASIPGWTSMCVVYEWDEARPSPGVKWGYGL